ncbi:MAG: hypothetical protein QOJ71_1655, partial [Actinomycetota bacterium]|nr:hypothetical protein [Actinomycetota bacterium]
SSVVSPTGTQSFEGGAFFGGGGV